MIKNDFEWRSNELLTKEKLDGFTFFLHHRFGFLQTILPGDYGFDIETGQTITYSITENNKLKASFPPMVLLFKDGYLYESKNKIDFDIEYRANIWACLVIQDMNVLSIEYCKDEKEAYGKNYLPFLQFNFEKNPVDFLRPVIRLSQSVEYENAVSSLEKKMELCEKNIQKFFIDKSLVQHSFLTDLRSFIFQVFFLSIIQVQAKVANTNIGSFSYFNSFREILLLTNSFEESFKRIDEANGNSNYSIRERVFIANMNELIINNDFLHSNENISKLISWMETLVNIIIHFSGLKNPFTDKKEAVLASNIPEKDKRIH